MSTTVEAEATEGGTINDGNLNMAQEQTSRRGKIMYWGMDKNGIYVSSTSLLVLYSIFLLPPIAKHSVQL